MACKKQVYRWGEVAGHEPFTPCRNTVWQGTELLGADCLPQASWVPTVHIWRSYDGGNLLSKAERGKTFKDSGMALLTQARPQLVKLRYAFSGWPPPPRIYSRVSRFTNIPSQLYSPWWAFSTFLKPFWHVLTWKSVSYYNLSSVCGSVCVLTTPPFTDLRAPNLSRDNHNYYLLSSYKMATSMYTWESGRKPHWQGASGL